jgi:phosphosulfolactate phosphohydrolase-like enzyme
VNRAAVCKAVRDEPRIDLICAGTGGELSLDDAAAAGAIVDYLTSGSEWCCNDSATLCLKLWQQTVGASVDAAKITDLLSSSLGGRNLTELKMQHDIEFAAQLDLLDVVPKLNKANWWIRGE